MNITNFEDDNDFVMFVEIENLLWDPTLNNRNKAKEIINKYIAMKNNKFISSVLNMIVRIGYSRHLKFKELGDMYGYITSCFKHECISHQRFQQTNFVYYLYLRGLIQQNEFFFIENNNKSVDDYETKTTPETIDYFILRDDVAKMKEFKSKFHDFVNVGGERYSLINYSILTGAKNCLRELIRYSYLDNKSMETKICALEGGNEEIFRFLEQKGMRFDGMLSWAIRFHNNNIVKIILANYQCELIDPSICIRFSNTEMFFFFHAVTVNNMIPITEKEQQKCKTYAMRNGNLILIDCLKK